MYSVSQPTGQSFCLQLPKQAVVQPASQSVSQHLLVLAIRKNFLSLSSPPITPGHTHTHPCIPTLVERDTHTGTSQPNGDSCHTLLLFNLKQVAELPLKSSHIYSTDVSLSSSQMVYLQSSGSRVCCYVKPQELEVPLHLSWRFSLMILSGMT